MAGGAESNGSRTSESYVITFHMERRVERVITPVFAAQSERMCREYKLPRHRFGARAMWDTGSTGCAIDRVFAEEVGLAKHRNLSLGGAHGVRRTDTYLVDILLQDGFAIQHVEVPAVDGRGLFDLIIGMNVISRGDFSLSLVDGKTVMSFRLHE